LSADPTATENDVTVVNHGSLARSDGALRLVEVDFDAVWLGSGVQSRHGGQVLVANLHFSARRGGEYMRRTPLSREWTDRNMAQPFRPARFRPSSFENRAPAIKVPVGSPVAGFQRLGAHFRRAIDHMTSIVEIPAAMEQTSLSRRKMPQRGHERTPKSLSAFWQS